MTPGFFLHLVAQNPMNRRSSLFTGLSAVADAVVSTPREARAAGWINRHGGGGAWINR
jgi:hypothetical protein